MRSRTRAFALVTAVCMLGAVAAVLIGALDGSSAHTNAKVGLVRPVITVQARDVSTAQGPSQAPPPPSIPVDQRGIEPGTRAPAPPHPDPQHPATVVVRAQNPRDPRLNGAITIVPIGGGTAQIRKIFCERLAISGPRGICLTTVGVTSQVVVFDRRFATLHTLDVPGVPSRARVSADGRYGAITTFVVGHAYAAPGTFSTYTAIIDLARGRVLTSLEKLTTIRDGKILDAPDVNYWGVTFTGDSNRFYATVATGGRTYLVAGDIHRREMWTLRQNVECPSLSPDGTRIAFKKLVGGRGDWRLYVLDLHTMREWPLAEQRSIDDQAEWLDNNHVLYGDSRDVWSAQADGHGRPQRLFTHAASPIVIWDP